MFKRSPGGLLRRCIIGKEADTIIWHFHSSAYGGHHGGERIAAKMLQSGFWWPTLFKNCKLYMSICSECNITGNISKRDEMPWNTMLEVELFDCWGIDFMDPFPQSNLYIYILVCVDYVTKWVEEISCSANNVHTFTDFLKKNIFAIIGVPRVLISDGGTYFCNKYLERLLVKYNVKYKVLNSYHPHTCGQVEVLNRHLKQILEKTIAASQKDWLKKLDDALWAYKTDFKIHLGFSLYQFMYGMVCHLPIELEHKAYWTIKFLNFDKKLAWRKRLLKLDELEVMRLSAYENALVYKERTKIYHDKKLVRRNFQI